MKLLRSSLEAPLHICISSRILAEKLSLRGAIKKMGSDQIKPVGADSVNTNRA
jgi:hypothetical protein